MSRGLGILHSIGLTTNWLSSNIKVVWRFIGFPCNNESSGCLEVVVSDGWVGVLQGRTYRFIVKVVSEVGL
jgi:hypothetical protein